MNKNQLPRMKTYSQKYLKSLPRFLWPYDLRLYSYEITDEMFHAKYENDSTKANSKYDKFLIRTERGKK